MTPKILIVDDSITVRMDLAEAFASAGFDVTDCANLTDARRFIQSNSFGVIVLDVNLPDGDGLDLVAELKTNPDTSRIAVMLMSSEADVQDRIRGLKTGADEYVGKPYELTYVIARARELLRRSGSNPAAALRTILVIDDSPTFREELKRALVDAGFGVVTAATGEEGLRAAIDTRPAAVIVDGQLPGIDGTTVIRRIRADASLRGMPCLLLTASGERHEELLVLDAGADAYVRKQDEIGVILARLGAVLRSAGPAPANGSQTSLLGTKKVLAVDDSLTYLQEVAAQLRQEGYDLVLARSGEEAIDLLAVQTVDCILLDLLMPGLSGQETCRKIKSCARWREIPLIMLTAQEDRDAMIEGINAGADDYIAKSSEFEVLKARLRAQLRRKQFEDENRKIREQLSQKEIEASAARSARALAETRATLLADLQQKNVALAHAKSELEDRNIRVAEGSRLKSEFLANMSHELRTPLNAIIGFAELMFDGRVGPISEPHKEYLGDILSSGRHLLTLINDVLDLSKVEAGKMEFRPEAISIASIIEESADITRELATKKRLTISTEIDDTLVDLVLDPSKLKQVLYNYVSNAIKFTPEGGTIKVRALAEPTDRVRLEVEDSGIGIRSEDLDRLFVEFQQLDAGSQKLYPGTGLGLALTKKIIEAQGGEVGVRSEFGKGSVFFAVLPQKPSGTDVSE